MASKVKITLEEYQAVIQEQYDDWSEFLGVHHQWSVELVTKKAKDMGDSDSVAECSWPWNYRSATIRFNVDHLLKKQPTFREIRETVVHELGHLVNADLWDLINANFQGNVRKMLLDQCEKEIDTWTRIVMRAREDTDTEEDEDDDGVVSTSDSPIGAAEQNRIR